VYDAAIYNAKNYHKVMPYDLLLHKCMKERIHKADVLEIEKCNLKKPERHYQKKSGAKM